jgi:hypothetical protein
MYDDNSCIPKKNRNNAFKIKPVEKQLKTAVLWRYV